MRRFTLLIAVLSLVSLAYGQVAKKGTSVPVKQELVQSVQPNSSVKGAGEVFWSETFNWKDESNPQGWSLPTGWNIVDEADLGFYWKWMGPEDKVGGCCSKNQTAPTHFVSRADGCIFLPADPYNNRDGISETFEMNGHITTPPIDCSQKSSVVVKFNQYFRLCCNEAFNLMFQVTNDGGVHWATYDCRFGVGANNVTPTRFLSVEFNITDVAANLPNVQLRFYMQGPRYYYWMIDDLTLSEAYQNNLKLEDYWADANIGAVDPVGNINYWPLSQMGMTDAQGAKVGAYSFRGAILNLGAQDQNDQKLNLQILKNGEEILNQNSQAVPLWSLERDTIKMPDPFLATDYGDYKFNWTAVGDAADEVPANNTATLSFTVNDTLLHRPDFTSESSSGGGGWVDGGNGGEMVGVGYDIIAPCEINSIYARIAGIDSTAGTTFQFVLFKDMGEDGYIELITSDVIEATQEMVWTWQNQPVIKDGETEFLEPGYYIACVRMWGSAPGDDDGVNGMSVGWDKDTKWAGSYSWFYHYVKANSQNEWWSIDKLNQIGIVLNAIGGPTQAPVTFNVDMTRHIASGEFVPGTDVVDVIGLAPSWEGTVAMTDPDGDGIYSTTVESLGVASELHYKYQVNGTPEAYPTTGNPYRSYTVRYWNIINNTYNGGVTAGVDQNSLVASFNIYPNPTSGAFTVDVTSTVASDLTITLTNIQGQVIYQNKVANSVSYQESIDQKLSKGIYFLTVNNGKEVKVQKVVVQ
jgi:hypothetical protein